MAAQPLWQQAAAFAARAHRHQLRRDKQTPYFAHPVRVALTVACVFGFTDEKILAAALLHDTIEDTDTDYDEILHGFGKDVADMVAALSKDMRMVESRREPAYDAQLKHGSWQARLIKLADQYDNLHDLDTSQSPRHVIELAMRAVNLAKGDRQLSGARAIVMQLINAKQRQNSSRSRHSKRQRRKS